MKYSDSDNIAAKIIHKETARGHHRVVTRDNTPYILNKPGIQTLPRFKHAYWQNISAQCMRHKAKHNK